jgi:hypothetical protein
MSASDREVLAKAHNALARLDRVNAAVAGLGEILAGVEASHAKATPRAPRERVYFVVDKEGDEPYRIH